MTTHPKFKLDSFSLPSKKAGKPAVFSSETKKQQKPYFFTDSGPPRLLLYLIILMDMKSV